MLKASSFTFDSYKVDRKNSTITFNYIVEFKYGIKKTFKDKLILPNITSDLWDNVPKDILESTLQSLLLMIGINYWCVFPTKNIIIKEFKITKEQAQFWDSLYLNGLGEFFYDMKIDFHNLISFPYDNTIVTKIPTTFKLPNRSLLLNGAGKDSILSAEILKTSNTMFDFFAFQPTPAHKKIALLVGAKTITVTRRRDSWLDFTMSFYGVSSSYPSVSTFTFIATLLSELLGYNEIVFSNERSADFGNLNYLGLEVNHQWCKSSVAEKMTNDYIQKYITSDIKTSSLLRKYSELDIVQRFIKYPQYLNHVTSCNTYFWLPGITQTMMKKGYWCKRCAKCVFLFACFTAFLSKEKVIEIFGADLYQNKKLLPLFRRILGIEGFKPLDCVGEPEEMILAMHYAQITREYKDKIAMKVFEEYFPSSYDFESIEKRVFAEA